MDDKNEDRKITHMGQLTMRIRLSFPTIEWDFSLMENYSTV